jgi:hypothetical protein
VSASGCLHQRLSLRSYQSFKKAGEALASGIVASLQQGSNFWASFKHLPEKKVE